jgi:hypothetical protein
LDKKVRVAFDWTLDLLFPKDVCAVHDLDQRRDFRWPDHAGNTSGNNGAHEMRSAQLNRRECEGEIDDWDNALERFLL